MFIYESSSGKLIDPDSLLLAYGYSGHAEGLNNPLFQDIIDVGPIPEGWYTIGRAQDSPKHGPKALPLVPDPENEMFGRMDFWMHGDEKLHPGQHLASLGCIIEAEWVRDQVDLSPDKRLQVVGTIPKVTVL